MRLISHGYCVSGPKVKPGCRAIALMAQDVRDAHKRNPKRGRVVEVAGKPGERYAASGKGVWWDMRTGEVWVEG